MYRSKLQELIECFMKANNVNLRMFSEMCGVSVDTIGRITHPQNAEKDSAKVNTLEAICKVLKTEVWELFYTGNTSLVSLQAEIDALKAERDALIAENGALKSRVETLRDKVDALKDEIIATHNYYIKKGIS